MYKEITFKEYKETYKKMTKNEIAFHETKHQYRTKLNEETLLAELDAMKKEMTETKRKILQKIRADKI